MLKVEASKGVVSSLHAQVDKDMKDIVKDYMTCLTLPTHFLQNSLLTQGVPSPTLAASAATEAKDVEAYQGGVVKDSEGGVVDKE